MLPLAGILHTLSAPLVARCRRSPDARRWSARCTASVCPLVFRPLRCCAPQFVRSSVCSSGRLVADSSVRPSARQVYQFVFFYCGWWTVFWEIFLLFLFQFRFAVGRWSAFSSFFFLFGSAWDCVVLVRISVFYCCADCFCSPIINGRIQSIRFILITKKIRAENISIQVTIILLIKDSYLRWSAVITVGIVDR